MHMVYSVVVFLDFFEESHKCLTEGLVHHHKVLEHSICPRKKYHLVLVGIK
jgi:hypothetical protein